MQRILDIDLDFFLADCCPLAEIGTRPDVSGHEPWKEADVRRFLEDQCGLDKKRPVPGRIFMTHDMALSMWDELVRDGRLSTPFSVTHIDAHSDLGIGRPGPGFVLNTVISMHPQKRCDISHYYDMHELDEANYLLFAAGFRYVGEIINVRNPKSHEDIPREILHVSENGEKNIRLCSFVSKLMEKNNGSEPVIRYEEYRNPQEYKAQGKFDFASLAVSPRYSPREADALIDVIAEYFTVY